MSGYVELYLDQGSSFSSIIHLTDDTTNAAINALGYTVSSQLRKTYYSSNITANITCSFANTANGELVLTMPHTTTANIKAGRYVFDVKITDESNIVSRILEGIITVTPSVTK